MIYIQNDPILQLSNDSINLYSELLVPAAQKVLVYTTSEPDSEVTVVLTNDEQIQSLNKQYLDQDRPTDVLAFPAGDADPDTQILYLGDVVISYPRAKEQAEQAGHVIEEELQLLVVHGMLHLLGFNHIDEKEKAAMWDIQARILAELGCSPTAHEL